MSISGQYDGEMIAPTNGLGFLDLRIDVDKRYANSPVMKRVSGDFYQVNKINVPGSPPKVTRVYRESWIVNEPKVKKLNGKIEITGKVSFWKGRLRWQRRRRALRRRAWPRSHERAARLPSTTARRSLTRFAR
jgi:hypothetical protein